MTLDVESFDNSIFTTFLPIKRRFSAWLAQQKSPINCIGRSFTQSPCFSGEVIKTCSQIVTAAGVYHGFHDPAYEIAITIKTKPCRMGKFRKWTWINFNPGKC
jgi:hypothetical protein